ncbi:Ysc84 actin-binding domain protein [Kalmanozyma brasiliensis GHG001]|uniref:Ysc84 actin-binding domain protein n=1 Tax=Kalmanozyma brasiliensis (strain GHG001) TaxID=1365824 RepID=UPI002867F685|nr:Ysc84 actin-binding domain protein [Kalmanozyma brasiliensis GHG001]EST07635.2 Ysc84 actin-binding domain protein [Kalmanozyma brasiliensis GHG001]
MGNPIPVNLEQECRKATKILNEFVDPVNGLDKIVPISVLSKAKGFAIFTVFRIGFLLSARAGSGVVVAKADDGRWSAPAAIGIGGLGGGFNAGAEVTDFLIVLNSKSAVRSFMATGSLQLGGNMSVAVGPLGRSAEASGSVNTKGRVAAMFSYSKSKGLYGGISVEGTVLVNREDANVKAYGQYAKNPKQILSGAVDRPPWASGLVQTIERFTLANTPSKDLDGEYFNYDDTSSFHGRGYGGSGGGRGEESYDTVDSRDLEKLSRPGGQRRSSRSSQLEDLPDRFDDIGLRDRDRDRDSFEDRDRRRKDDDYDNRSHGTYGFGTSAGISNTPPRASSAASQRMSAIRTRSGSIASNLSFGSKKKLDRSGPTPPPDWDAIPGQSNGGAWGKSNNMDMMDSLDRELQGGSPSATRKSSYGPSGSGHNGDDRARSGSLSNTRGSSNTPAGWSQFSSDAHDDLFGDKTQQTRDPFEDLASTSPYGSGSSNGHSRTKSAYDGAAPPPSKTGSRFGRFRTPSPGSSAFGRKKTPTIPEDDTNGYGDRQNVSLISPSALDEYRNGDSRVRKDSFSLASENASVPVIERVIALYDFEAQEEGDLGFQKGQVIAVTKKTDSTDDWWQGRVEAGVSSSKTGIFPRNYTAPL